MLDQVLALGEITENVGAQVLCHFLLLLLLARIEGNNAEAHSLSILARQRT